MKMLKKIAIPFLLLTVLSLCFVLVSCQQECAHEYGEWTVTKEATCTEDGEQVRTCSLCEVTEAQTITASGHTSEDLLCGTCGEEIVGVESLFPTVDPTISTVGIVVKDIVLASSSDSSATLELAEAVIYLDENGMPKLYAEETVTSPDGSVSVLMFTEGDVIYVKANNGDQDVYTSIPLSSYVEPNPEVIEMLEMVGAYLPAIEAWLNESFLPCFVIPSEGIELPEVSETDARKALTSALDLFFTVEAAEDGAVVALDLSIIKEVNGTLNEKTVAELIDLVGGEGAFLQLQAFLPRILNFTVNDLVTFLSLNLGVDISALLTSLDELAVIITGTEDATFEALLGIEGDIDAILADEELLATSVKDVLMASLELTTEEELNTAVAEVVAMLNATTLYELLGVDSSVFEQINTIVDGISALISYEITVGSDGKFVSSTLELSSPEDALYVTATLTAEKMTVNLNDGEAKTNNITFEIIPGYTITLDEAAMAATKDIINAAPAVDAELLAQNSNFIPVYENGALVGAYVWNRSYTPTEIDDETVEIEVMVKLVDINTLREIQATAVSNVVNGYLYSFNSTTQYRTYTVSAADFNAAASGNDFVHGLITSDAIYVLDSSYGDEGEYIYVYYNTESGEFVEYTAI